jgi:hypothetical protein
MRLAYALLLVLIAQPAVAANWLYCQSVGRFYPYAQSCPEGWKEVKPNAAPNGGMALPPKPADMSLSGKPSPDPAGSFGQGLADRTTWENWDAGLTGDYRAGADWWSGHRSVPGSVCSGAADWLAGCLASKAMLDPDDVRRKSDVSYRKGWNSYQPPAAVAHAEEGQALPVEKKPEPLAVAAPEVIPPRDSEAIVVTMDVSVSGGGRPSIAGTTNLPDGTRLMTMLQRPYMPDASARQARGLPACEPDCVPVPGPTDQVVVKNGHFEDGPFTDKGAGLPRGRYVLEIYMPATLQPKNVVDRIGARGEHLSGPLMGGCCFGDPKKWTPDRVKETELSNVQLSKIFGPSLYYARHVDIVYDAVASKNESTPFITPTTTQNDVEPLAPHRVLPETNDVLLLAFVLTVIYLSIRFVWPEGLLLFWNFIFRTYSILIYVFIVFVVLLIISIFLLSPAPTSSNNRQLATLATAKPAREPNPVVSKAVSSPAYVADPYAGEQREARNATFERARDAFLSNVEDLYFAVGCKVFKSEFDVSILISHEADSVALQADSYQSSDAADFVERINKAKRYGLAIAATTGKCDYWHNHPEAVESIRLEAEAAMQ